MTAGPTGVVWLPRTAAVNSAALLAGAGPVPLAAAGVAWTSVASALADATAAVTRVTAELAVGWSGDASSAASGRLAAFTVWGTAAAEQSATLAARATAQATAVTTALAVMPSLPEIAAVKTGRATAYAVGGALTGAAQAADAADAALDVRAALVMEAYEAASAYLVVPTTFDPPPQIVAAVTATTDAPIGPVLGADDRAVDARPDEQKDSEVTPSLVEDVHGAAHDPSATRAASVAQQIPSQLVSALSTGVPSTSVTSTAAGGGAVGSWAPTPPMGGSGAFGASTVTAGWSGSGTTGGHTSRTPFATSVVGGDTADGDGRVGAGGSGATARMPIGAGVPMGHARQDDDTVVEHRLPDSVLDFGDGVAVVPAVIGGVRP